MCILARFKQSHSSVSRTFSIINAYSDDDLQLACDACYLVSQAKYVPSIIRQIEISRKEQTSITCYLRCQIPTDCK